MTGNARKRVYYNSEMRLSNLRLYFKLCANFPVIPCCFLSYLTKLSFWNYNLHYSQMIFIRETHQGMKIVAFEAAQY